MEPHSSKSKRVVGRENYCTKKDTVDICLNCLHECGVIGQGDILLEPSAGMGVFSDALKEKYPGYTVEAYDIVPNEEHDVVQQNFLDLDTSVYEGKKVHIVGNPPFGRQASMVRRFIKKASWFGSTIAFILPRSFKKNSMKSTFPMKYWLLKSIDLPEKSFCDSTEEKNYSVPCVFQVWQRRDEDRPEEEPVVPTYYTYVSKEGEEGVDGAEGEAPSVAIRRVGINAGTISATYADKSRQTHYFLRLNQGIAVNDFIKKYQENVRFEEDNTVGPRSVSKEEINKALDGLME